MRVFRNILAYAVSVSILASAFSLTAEAISDYYVVVGSGSIPASSIGNECIKVLTV